MDSRAFVLLLFVTAVTRTATLILDATRDTVTVREGEQLNLSCSITFDGGGIREVRWYRDTNRSLYGSIDVQNCGTSHPCPEVNTTDNRGVVNFTRGFLEAATLTLVINRALTRDNTSFYCGLLTTSNDFPRSNNIHVIVQHLPDPSYPMCLRSNSSTNADILSLSCWAEITQPVVSLDWTVEGYSSDQISFTSKTETGEDRVESTLFLNEPGIPSGSLVFTCHMTSSAFRQIQRNCLIGPILIPGGQTTVGTLSSTDQTTAGFLPDPTTTTTPQNHLGSTDPTTTPFRDGTPTTPTTSKVITQNNPELNTIVIAATASACLVVIIILLIIIACLVSSRRTRSRGADETNPKDLSIRLSVAITSPGSNTNLSHEAHVYANEIVPALSSSNRPGRLEIPPCDHTASYPPSPLYAAVSSVKKAPQIGDGSYAVVSKRDKRRGNSPLEHQPNMGHGSQDPPEYHTLEPGARQLSQAGQEPESTEGQFEYAIPGQGSRSWRSSQLDEDDGKLIDNVLYTTQNEYM